jgi:hypothetical protein
MAIIKFLIDNTASKSNDYFFKRNSALLKFLSYDYTIKDDIVELVKRFPNNKFLVSIAYFTTFKHDEDNSIEFDEYYKYITFIVDTLSEICEYEITELEKKAIIYSIILKTSDRFTPNDIAMTNIELSNFADIDTSKLPNVWVLVTLGNYYLDILKVDNNLKLFLKILNAVVTVRIKYEEIDKIIPHLNDDSLWKEFEQYEVQ